MLHGKPNVFVSYRRDDSSGVAGRLCDYLTARLGGEQVFRDVTGIAPGADFFEVLQERVGACDVLIALIGRHWLAPQPESGRSRLDDPDDLLGRELRIALEKQVRIIPVLVDDAKMPAEKDLPADLAALAGRQAFELSDKRWDYDAGQLFDALSKPLLPAAAPPPRRWAPQIGPRQAAALLLAAVALAAGAGITAGWRSWRTSSTSPKITTPPPLPPFPRGLARPVVAVLPFVNHSDNRALNVYTQRLAERVRHDLEGSWSVTVRPLESLTAILTAASSDGEGEGGIASIAAGDGIHYLVTGEVRPGGLTLVARVEATGGARNVETAEVYGLTPEKLPAGTETVVILARKAMGLPSNERIGLWTADFPTEKPEAYKDVVAGLEALNLYHYAEARRDFTAALQIAPNYQMARYRLAWAHALDDQTRSARALIAEVGRAEGLDGRERLYVGAAAHYIARDYGEAERVYRQLLRTYPREIEPRQHLAHILLDEERYDEALRIWQGLAQLEPRENLQLSKTLLGLDRFHEAETQLEPLLREGPDRSAALFQLGEIHEQQGELDRAENLYRQALASDPTYSEASLALARSAAQRGRAEEASSLLADLLDQRSNPRDRIVAGFELAHILKAGGRFHEAAGALASLSTEIAEQEVWEAWALSIRGLCAAEAGDGVAARALIAEAIARAPRSGPPTRYLFARGWLELRRGDLAAVRLTAAAIHRLALPPGNPDRTEEKAASYLEGMARLAEGRTAQALAPLHRAVILAGTEYRLYRLALAQAHLAAGRLVAARTEAEATLAQGDLLNSLTDSDLDLDRNLALLTLAHVEQAAGRRGQAAERARQFLDRWRRADPSLPQPAQARAILAWATSASPPSR